MLKPRNPQEANLEALNVLVQEQLTEAAAVLAAFHTPEKLTQVVKAASVMAQALYGGQKIISCGNGGSHADAMHFAEELSGRFRENRPALAAMAVSDPTHLTCVGNDYGYDHVFSRAVEAWGKPGDVLLGISTSGNSANVLKAIEQAQKQGMRVVALTGKQGGAIAQVLRPDHDIEIRVEHNGYADRIQEVHIKVIHNLILLIEQQLFGQ